MKLTLTSIQRYDKDKEGKPLKTRDNRLYTRLVIRAKEHGDKPISGFDNEATKEWQVGQEVEAEVTENGQYLNFKVLSKQDILAKTVERQGVDITRLKLAVSRIEQKVFPSTVEGTDIPYPTPESEGIDPNGVPF